MPDITEVVNVQVSVESAGVKGLDFGIPLVLGSTGFDDADLVRTYSNLDEVLEDFATTDDEYKMAARLFGQDKEVDHVLIGERTAAVAQVATIDVSGDESNGTYTVTINGVAHNFAASSSTATQIRDGLIAAIDAGTEPVDAALTDSDSFTVTADNAGQPFTITVTSPSTDLTLTATTANRGVQDDIAAIKESGDLGKAWFALLITSRAKWDILEAAEYCETRTHVFIGSSSDAAILAATAGNVQAMMASQAYKHSFHLYSGNTAAFPDAALFGVVLPEVVGSWSAHMQTLAGITADQLTSTQIANLKTQKGTYYVNVGSSPRTQGGQSANGNWFDAYVGAMWIESEANVAIFNMMAQRAPLKLPFTDEGIQLVVNALRGVLQRATDNGILAAEDGEPAFVIDAPAASTYSSAQKATRIMDGITFTGNLAGAIHKTTISGKVVN